MLNLRAVSFADDEPMQPASSPTRMSSVRFASDIVVGNLGEPLDLDDISADNGGERDEESGPQEAENVYVSGDDFSGLFQGKTDESYV